MLITHQREKLLNAVIFFLRHTKFCGKTKLFKLLYFADFKHFRETGRSVTGLEYYAWQHGPYPKEFAKELEAPPDDLSHTVNLITSGEANSFTNIKPKGSFDSKYFTKRELRILNEVAEVFRDAQAADIREASHLKNHPWDITIKTKGDRKKIDYMLALDGSKGSLTPEEAVEIISEHKELLKVLND